jgi:hypothetical protein
MNPKFITEEIQNFFKNNHGFELRYDLERNKHLVREYIPFEHLEDNQMIWFISNEEGVIWSEDYCLEPTKDDQGKYMVKFENSFRTEGKLGYSYGDNEFYAPVSFELIYLVYKYPEFPISPNHRYLFNYDQKIERDFAKMLERKIESLGINRGPDSLGVTYSTLCSLWKRVDKLNGGQILSTSYHFWNDLHMTLDLIIDQIGEINFYSDYLRNYGIQSWKEEPTIHLGPYEKKFLNSSSFCLHTIYGFWEKIAYLAFQFLPQINDVNSKNLSYNKLIEKIKKSIDKGNLDYLNKAESSINWFLDFNIGDHSKLRDYRHPLVHFQEENALYKGNLYASAYNYYLDNISDDLKRRKLEDEFKILKFFLNRQLNNCTEGFQKLIELIEEIP